MNRQGIELVRNMKAEGIEWSLTRAEVPLLPSEPSRKVSGIRVTLHAMQGDQEVQFEKDFQLHWDYSLEQLLAATLKQYLPDSPARRRYLDSHGNVPVRLQPNVMECIPEAVHTALRKLADGDTSVLTWNAIHHIHPYDRGQLWGIIEKTLREQFDAARANGAAVKRRSLATNLAQEVEAELKRCSHTRICDAKDGEGNLYRDQVGSSWAERTPAEEFALRTLVCGVRLTDIEEWMYGWLGYVIEDAPHDEDAQHPASSVQAS